VKNEEQRKISIFFTVEGRTKSDRILLDEGGTVKQFAKEAQLVLELGSEIVHVYFEDDEDPVPDETLVEEQQGERFRLYHLASVGRIKVTVQYQNDSKTRDFSSASTVRKVTKWAVGPEGFNLQGSLLEFDLKFGTEILPADLHLGQLGKKDLLVSLVQKNKPQG
jgi:hypothetical protein